MKYLGSALVSLGALMLMFYPTLWVYGKVSQFYLHRNWKARAVAAEKKGHGSVVGRLVVPKFQLDQIVLEGVGDAQLAAGPGHFKETALPGQGNCVVAGHLNTNGSPFKDLDQLVPGDEVLFETPEHLVFYKMSRREIVYPDDLGVLSQKGPRRLTLVTCMPGARERLVVYCKQARVE